MGDLFEFEAIKQAKSQKFIPTDNSKSGIPYIVQSNFNNMFSRNVDKQWLIDNNEPPISGNRIVLGVTLPAVSYQPIEFGASQVITAKSKWLNNKNGNFIVTVISKLMYQFSYNKKPGLQIYKDMEIKLPCNNGKLDFDFMENFISKLEVIRISQLGAYLLATNLKNYTLTDDENKILSDIENKRIEFNEYKVNDLFEINSYKKRFDANKITIADVGNPYVVRMSTNNGVRGYINEDEEYLNDGNTISFGQDTATVFYQEKPYFTGDKVKIMKPRDDKFNKTNAMFLVSAITKSFSSFTWGASSFSEDIIKKQLIDIPVKDNKPDYETMEILISAIQKLVIKDLVLYVKNKGGE